MKKFSEYVQATQANAANITASNANQIINQLDPTMKQQWTRLTYSLPNLYAFLSELATVSKNTWKVSPSQFTTILNKYIVKIAGTGNIMMPQSGTQ